MDNRPHLKWVAIGTICLFVLSRIYGIIFFETKYYFTPSDIANASNNELEVIGILLRLALPIIAGILIGYASRGKPTTEALLSGFLTALLLSWPVIYFPTTRSLLLPSSIASKPGLIWAIYGSFIASYSLLCKTGANMGLLLRKFSTTTTFKSLFAILDMKDALRTVIIGVITTALWNLLST